MNHPPVEIVYGDNLSTIETLLNDIEHAGHFYMHQSLAIPMPTIKVSGIGALSLPLLPVQIEAMIEVAARAPYGRGEQTIVDTDVRKVWQLPSKRVTVSGKHWPSAMDQLLMHVCDGLGYPDATISADFYKLLVYTEGDFFLPHRDTEKIPGMFGTLVISLPCDGLGGELVIHHGTESVTLAMNNDEPSEVIITAFYADCEHEVKPIRSGARVSLIYNLVQTPKVKDPVEYVDHQERSQALGDALLQAFDTQDKLVWLLAHQYSPAGLSFAGLKGEDAVRAAVLMQTAEQIGLSVHLGIVHIVESGAAELGYDDYEYSPYRYDQYDDEYDEEEESRESEFEIIEMIDLSLYIDNWIGPQGTVEFTEIPLVDGELLPAYGLDDAEPDKLRLMEATGNEGASYERSYHRAALVTWPEDNTVNVLLQAGVGSALPYVAREITSGRQPTFNQRAVVRQLIQSWPMQPRWDEPAADRVAILNLLSHMTYKQLSTAFIKNVVTPLYDGSENDSLTTVLQHLTPERGEVLVSHLIKSQVEDHHDQCIELLVLMGQSLLDQPSWSPVMDNLVRTLLHSSALREAGESVPGQLTYRLLELLTNLGKDALQRGCDDIVSNEVTFDPASTLVDALTIEPVILSKPLLIQLWTHAIQFLLARSEYPPLPPSDWRQIFKDDFFCGCEDCRNLKAFTTDPAQKIARFAVKKSRRRHLHSIIRLAKLDMTHETERRGSPHTLVCIKTLRAYQRQVKRYLLDLDALRRLESIQAVVQKRLRTRVSNAFKRESLLKRV